VKCGTNTVNKYLLRFSRENVMMLLMSKQHYKIQENLQNAHSQKNVDDGIQVYIMFLNEYISDFFLISILLYYIC